MGERYDNPPKHTEGALAKLHNVETLSPATQAKYAKAPLYAGVVARFPLALEEVAKVSVYGTKKHKVRLDDMSYLSIPDAYAIYSDAVLRHVTAEALHGPVNPQDGGLLHAAQLAWNALARLEVMLRHQAKGEAP